MSNPFTSVREAVWALFDANAELAAFIDAREGTRYRFGESENLPVRLAADDCPALAVTPAATKIAWETTAAHGITYRIEVRGYTAGTEAAEIEEFAYLAYAALMSGLPDFGLPAVEGVEFAGPVFATWRKGRAQYSSPLLETWHRGNARFASFVFGVLVRIHTDLV